QQITSLEEYASSPHLLVMNGCDHQPIQTDLSEAIETAEKLYPEITFKHSNFNDYVDQLTDTLPETLKEIEGELRSQQTDGWGTLVNTASSRMYLKKKPCLRAFPSHLFVGFEVHLRSLLKFQGEPLSAFSHMLGEDAQKDQLR